MNNQIESVLDQVFEPYLKHGADDYIGESVLIEGTEGSVPSWPGDRGMMMKLSWPHFS